MKHRKNMLTVSHDQEMIAALRKDSEFAAEYLKAAMEDSDEPKVLLIALRQLAEARGGVAKIATSPRRRQSSARR